MAGTGPGDLHALALELLQAAAEALDTVPTYDPALGGAPDRQFVGAAPIVLDCCELLAVSVGVIREGASAPSPPKASLARINRVALTVTIARCVPVQDSNGNPPSPEELEASAEQIHADKWALWNHLYTLITEGLLFDRCCDVIWDGLQPLAASGGCGGSTLSLTVCFDGYDSALGT